MIKIGIIGAGTIADVHLRSYKSNPECEIVAIADLNLDLAKERADEYGIKNVFSDYREILEDSEIDAVSIVTPTFTHKDMVIEALKSGKHVLCEKPPALIADDVRKCVDATKETGKLLMYAMVCRFFNHTQYLKKYIESGNLGDFTYAEAVRTSQCIEFNGWLCNKDKCGGFLFDSGIHELDTALYLMGYPKPKKVFAYASYANSDLPQKLKGNEKNTYQAKDTNTYKRTIDSLVTANIILDNGACLNIKTSSVLNTLSPMVSVEICGTKAGARIERLNDQKPFELLEITNEGTFNKTAPEFEKNDVYAAEVNHFVDCVINKTECICKPGEAITLVETLNAIYKSSETGEIVEL